MQIHPLKKFLRKNGLTQKEFALRAGFSKEWISDILTFKKIPSYKSAQKLSEATDNLVKPHEFFKVESKSA